MRDGELNFGRVVLTEASCLCISETLRREARRCSVRALNLSRCVIPSNGLKYLFDALNELGNVSRVTVNENKLENRAVIPSVYAALERNTSVTEYESRFVFDSNAPNRFCFVFVFRLRLDGNYIGSSVEAFANLCKSLTLNSVLNTLSLENNDLCEKCGFHFATMLNTNRSLKAIGNYIIIDRISVIQ